MRFALNQQEERLSSPQPPPADFMASDRTLVIRAKAGETRAFDQLVRKYRDRILKLTLRYTRNQADAEDAAQIAFMRAYRGLKFFRGDAAFYSWLHRIAMNSAATMLGLRRREASVFRSGTSARAELSETSEAFKELDTPEELALTEEMLEVILGGIGCLCEEQRSAIIMHEWEGLSYAEVAGAMSCPLGTVRSRVFRAREFIDNRLRHVYEEGLGRKRAARSETAAACRTS
jgi:RNA polymerase sigma-70 factor (ECF subfamily)